MDGATARPSVALPAIVLLCCIALFCLAGCGKSEDPANAGFDADDGPVRYFGHAAGPAEARAIIAVVKRYYVAAAARDGAEGCRLLYSLLAETLVDEYGHVASVSGSTCAAVLTKLFDNNHREAVRNLAKFHPFSIRAGSEHGLALYRIEPTTIRRMIVRREHGLWKIDALLNVAMP
jgi:hypothetical protein